MKGICETCGNDYDKAFQIVYQGKTHTFDCFECAIEALAPRCATCGCHVLGHGVEAGDIYCSAHCARKAGKERLADRAQDLMVALDGEYRFDAGIS